MSLKDLCKEIPSLVWNERHVQELSESIKKLSQGSPFERKALEHWFETCLRENLDLRTAYWDFRKSQKESDLLAFGIIELNKSLPAAVPDELMKMAKTRSEEIKGTVQKFLTTTFEVLEAFIEPIEPVIDEVIKTLWKEGEQRLEGSMDGKIDRKLQKMDPEKRKAIVGPEYDPELRASDLFKMLEDYGRISKVEAVNKAVDKIKGKESVDSQKKDPIAKLFEDYSR